jgi:preprotein translocase subunit Sec63
MSLTIPQTLFTTLQSCFDMEAKRIGREMAKLLDVPEKEVLQILKRVPKVSLTLHDDTEFYASCPILIQSNSIAYRCRRGCILGTNRCVEHQTIQIDAEKNIEKEAETKAETQPIIKLTRLKTTESCYWCNEETSAVYDATGKQVGFLKNNRIERPIYKDTYYTL